MLRSRLGLKALILCGILASLSAFTAAGAQATPGAHWWLVKPTDGKLVELTATALLTQEGTGKLLTKIAGITVVFECTSGASTGGQVEKEGSVSKSNGGFTIKFSGCTTKLNGATSAPCVPNNEGKESGVIKTKLLHGLIELHELSPGGPKDHLVKILPVAEKVLGEDKPFATIEMGAECAIGTKVNVIGKLRVKECSPHTLLEHLETHLFEQGPLTELFAISRTAEHASTLDGSVTALLTGEHKDWKFSGTTL
jgi:hypothetical protein